MSGNLLYISIWDGEVWRIRWTVVAAVDGGVETGRADNGVRRSAGVYFYRIRAGEFLRAKKIVLE